MKIPAALFICLLVATLTSMRAGAAEDNSPQEKFSNAIVLMKSHKFVEALPLLDDLKTSYPTATVFWNLGISAAEVGDNAKALQAWLAYRYIVPNDWRTRAKLVQAYQSLNDFVARDQERSALVTLWKAGTDAQLSAQSVFCRETFWYEGKKVMVLEYFSPSSPTMVVYSFVVLNDSGQQDFKISLGSYDATNQVALELGQRPKDKRIYHLDLYRQNYHETHGMFVGQPSYDEIRSVVLDTLSGKNKAMSSSSKPAIATH